MHDDRTLYEKLMSWFFLLVVATGVIAVGVVLIEGVVAKIGGGVGP